MNWKHAAFVLAAAVVPAACSDSSSVTDPQLLALRSAIAGNYAASEFTYSTDKQTWNLASEGSTVNLLISENGMISGHMFVPAEDASAESYDADLAGTWTMRGDTVYFSHFSGEATILSTMPFVVSGNTLSGRRQYVDGLVKLTLVRKP